MCGIKKLLKDSHCATDLSMNNISFTLLEIVSILGITQCVYIIVAMVMRAGRLARAGLPLLYFFVLLSAFTLDFGRNYISDVFPHYEFFVWVSWFSCFPLSFLLIIQIAHIARVPKIKHYWALLLIAVSYSLASTLTQYTPLEMIDALWLVGVFAGAVSMLAVWFNRSLMAEIASQKAGAERYWLIVALVMTNITSLAGILFYLSDILSPTGFIFWRNLLGLGFIYLVITSLFRIYPQAVLVEEGKKKRAEADIGPEEREIIVKVRSLLELDKVYQECGYSRTDLAREVDASDALISKLVNSVYNKSVPQLLNEYRIEDAKRMLMQTDASVKVIAQEVGFNSLPTFNRVFKTIEGDSPSDFRKKQT